MGRGSVRPFIGACGCVRRVRDEAVRGAPNRELLAARPG